jgi:hypothetical protein
MAADDFIRLECFNCKATQPLDNFHKDKQCVNRHQRSSRCKSCAKKQRAESWLRLRDVASARHKDWLAKNADRVKEYQKKYDLNRAEQKREYMKGRRERNNEIVREYTKRHPERIKAASKKYYYKNIEKIKADIALRQKTNKAYYLQRNAQRKAMKINATPEWADLKKIESIYEEAARDGLSVDHIVPLKSKLVCGLHVQENLQLLPLAENIKKGNRWWPDMP